MGWVGAHSVASRLEVDDRGRLHLVPHVDVEASFAALVDLSPSSTEAARAELEAVTLLVEAQVSVGADITIRDSEGVRLRLSAEPPAEGAAIRLQRPGHDDVAIPGHESTEAEIRILLDADLVEVFGTTGYAAVRLRSTRDPVIELAWTTGRPPLIRTLTPDRAAAG